MKEPRCCERGQTMAEYAVMLGLITIAIVVALQTLGGVVAAHIEEIADLIP